MIKNLDSKIIDHTFVASILEDVYVDDLNEQRYLCAAVIITFKWILSGSSCIKEEHTVSSGIYRIFVRAGSNYWIRGGSEHEIKRIVTADSTTPYTVTAIELQIEFPRLPSIRPVMLSATSLFADYGIAEMYGWRSNDLLPLKYRKKYVKMMSESVITYRDICENVTNRLSNLFCATEVKPRNDMCMYLTGFPLIRKDILVGIDVGGVCDQNRNITIHLIYEISYSINWLQGLTGVYVEYA